MKTKIIQLAVILFALTAVSWTVGLATGWRPIQKLAQQTKPATETMPFHFDLGRLFL